MTPTGSILFFSIFLLAIIATTWSNRGILFAGAAILLWIWLFFRLFFGDNPIIGLEEEFAPFLAFAFVLIVFGALFMRMNTEIRNEAKGKSWKTWGAPPGGKASTMGERAQEHRKNLRGGRR